MAPKKKGKGKGKKGQRKKVAPSGGGGSPAVTPALDRGELAGLRSRPDLNGRRVEVREQVVGKDGAPRLAVRLLFGAGAGTVLKVKAGNVELDKDRALDPAMATLVAEMQALAPGAPPPEDRRDWAGLPEVLLEKIAATHVARTEAGWAAQLKERGWPEKDIQEEMAERERDGNCLFVFALVCKEWRKAQLKVGGPLRTRVRSDVILPGSVALAKWALAEGCPREDEVGYRTMAHRAAEHGHLELTQWLCGEGGFAMDGGVMAQAARGGSVEVLQWLSDSGCPQSCGSHTVLHAAECGRLQAVQWLMAEGCPWDEEELIDHAASSGNLELVQWLYQAEGCGFGDGERTMAGAAGSGNLELAQWLRGKGCPWNHDTCYEAVEASRVEVLRWARENGCPWDAETRDKAAAELGYTDDLGNLV